jgi:hypothetical protein
MGGEETSHILILIIFKVSRLYSPVFSNVEEPHHVDAAPALAKKNIAAPANVI